MTGRRAGRRRRVVKRRIAGSPNIPPKIPLARVLRCGRAAPGCGECRGPLIVPVPRQGA
jgi:hypothetical protein